MVLQTTVFKSSLKFMQPIKPHLLDIVVRVTLHILLYNLLCPLFARQMVDYICKFSNHRQIFLKLPVSENMWHFVQLVKRFPIVLI